MTRVTRAQADDERWRSPYAVRAVVDTAILGGCWMTADTVVGLNAAPD